jgi:hypothetical protein
MDGRAVRVSGATLLADEGMWRIDQLPRDASREVR